MLKAHRFLVALFQYRCSLTDEGIAACMPKELEMLPEPSQPHAAGMIPILGIAIEIVRLQNGWD